LQSNLQNIEKVLVDETSKCLNGKNVYATSYSISSVSMWLHCTLANWTFGTIYRAASDILSSPDLPDCFWSWIYWMYAFHGYKDGRKRSLAMTPTNFKA